MEIGYDYGPRRSTYHSYDTHRPAVGMPYERSDASIAPSYPPSVGPSRPPPPVPHSSGVGIRVALKREYQIAPPPQLLPLTGDIPHSTFQFNFDLEKRILTEAEKEIKAWNRIISTSGRELKGKESNLAQDPVVRKYTVTGFDKEAVVLALAAFGDVQNKVADFVMSYNLLCEMGFPSDDVARALVMYDNDKERALQHFVKGL